MPRNPRVVLPETMPMADLAGHIARLEVILNQASRTLATYPSDSARLEVQNTRNKLEIARAVHHARLAAGDDPAKTTRNAPQHIAWRNEARRLRAVPARIMGKAFSDLSAAYSATKGLLPAAVNEAAKEMPDMPDVARVFAPLHEAVARCEAEVTAAIRDIYRFSAAATEGSDNTEDDTEGEP